MGLSTALRDNLLAGLVLVAPLVVTALALRTLFSWVSAAIDPTVTGTRLATYTANIEVVAQLLAIVAILASLVLLGAVARWGVGERVFGEVGW
jgi:uncharacterized membrane protein